MAAADSLVWTGVF